SFVGIRSIPIRHGMSLGELALYCNDKFKIGSSVNVVPVKGWDRSRWNKKMLPWIPPSPNIPTVETASIYPGTCLIEGTNLSEGRGTTKPFEWIGAPWIDSEALVEKLSEWELPGVAFRPIQFSPKFSKFKNELVHGVHVHVTD